MVFRGLDYESSAGVTQSPVSDYRVVFVMFQLFDGVVRRDSRSYDMTGSFQNRAFQLHDVRFVVHAEDLGHRGSFPPRWGSAKAAAFQTLNAYSAAAVSSLSNRQPGKKTG